MRAAAAPMHPCEPAMHPKTPAPTAQGRSVRRASGAGDPAASSEPIIPSERESAATACEEGEVVVRKARVAAVIDVEFVEQILHAQAQPAEAGLVADARVGEGVAAKIVALVGLRPV